jgi:hypothetical protein
MCVSSLTFLHRILYFMGGGGRGGGFSEPMTVDVQSIRAVNKVLDLPWDRERVKHDISSTLKQRNALMQTTHMVPCSYYL